MDFLRGLVRGRGHWGDFGRLFQARFPNDTFEMLDLPGNGERGEEKSPLRLKDYVDLIRTQSAAIQAGRPVHMLALSLGAMITVEWMKLYPQDFVKSYLVCTSTAGLKFYERFRPVNYLRILPLMLPHSAERHEAIMLNLLSNKSERQKEVAADLIEYSQAHPVRALNFFRQMLAAAGSNFPESPPGQVILIGSYGDKLVSPQCTLKIARRWSLEPIMHPSAGHDLAIDDPQWLPRANGLKIEIFFK